MKRLERMMRALLSKLEAGQSDELQSLLQEVRKGCPWDTDEIQHYLIYVQEDGGGFGPWEVTATFAEAEEAAKRLFAQISEDNCWDSPPYTLMYAEGLEWEKWS